MISEKDIEKKIKNVWNIFISEMTLKNKCNDVLEIEKIEH